MSTPTLTLGEDLPKQMARVRDEVLPVCLKIGAPGRMAVAMMRADLDAAAKALAEGDVVAMVRVHLRLRGYSL